MNRLLYVILFTPELERMKRFYHHGVGLPVSADSPDWTEFGTSGATLALHAVPDAAGKGIQLRFGTHGIDARARELESRGVRLDHGIQNSSMGRLAAFRDPEGGQVSIYEPAKPFVEGRGPVLSTVIVNCRDMAAAKAFYRNKLAFHPTMDSSWWVEYDTGPTRLALHPRGERAAGERHHGQPITIGLAATDLAAWVEELRARGVSLESAPRDTGFGLMAEAADPDGNMIVFREIPEPPEHAEELAEAFEDDSAPQRSAIRKPVKKGSKAVSRVAVRPDYKSKADSKRSRPAGAGKRRVASVRGAGEAGARLRPKRTADVKKAKAKPAIGRLKKAKRRVSDRQRGAVAAASKGKPVKRAAARTGR